MRQDDNIFTDWGNFEVILQLALRYWPQKVELFAQKDNEGTPLGFNAFTFDDQIDTPYFEQPDCKHIVRHMLWAIFCALPKNFNGIFELKNIDRKKVKEKFENSILSDIQKNDLDPEEVAYYESNLKNKKIQ
jgi:hypothetical protein